ncbi:39443_t:CDS:1 [Gigaspora margarita]|uniref:39443_t:CDS:1 n=1 Tax=Gigaspora margarita TaxID=4874 RepID=A0ABN7VA29_GIGMA|nr:39443_t:CDS:1 [Gigaspora margarita]
MQTQNKRLAKENHKKKWNNTFNRKRRSNGHRNVRKGGNDPFMANNTNKVKQLQDKLQDLVIQEENKKSHSTKIDGSAHDKGRKNIYESRWTSHNRTKVTTTTQTKTLQRTNSMTNQSHSRQKPITTITIWYLPEDAQAQKI